MVAQPSLRLVTAMEYTPIPNCLIEDRTLGHFELRLYMTIRRRDWAGKGWVFKFADLLEILDGSTETLRLALAHLDERGLIRSEGQPKRPKRYFALAPSDDGSQKSCDPIAETLRSDPPPITEILRSDPAPIARILRSNRKDIAIQSQESCDPLIRKNQKQSKRIKTSSADESADASTSDDQAKDQTAPPVTGADLLIDQMKEALGCKELADGTRAKWKPVLRAGLKECTPDERRRFVRWLVSDGYWTSKMVYRLNPGQLQTQIEGWIADGKPEAKEAPITTTARSTKADAANPGLSARSAFTLSQLPPSVSAASLAQPRYRCACGAVRWEQHKPECRLGGQVGPDHFIPEGQDYLASPVP